jgi:hypothetical protein
MRFGVNNTPRPARATEKTRIRAIRMEESRRYAPRAKVNVTTKVAHNNSLSLYIGQGPILGKMVATYGRNRLDTPDIIAKSDKIVDMLYSFCLCGCRPRLRGNVGRIRFSLFIIVKSKSITTNWK